MSKSDSPEPAPTETNAPIPPSSEPKFSLRKRLSVHYSEELIAKYTDAQLESFPKCAIDHLPFLPDVGVIVIRIMPPPAQKEMVELVMHHLCAKMFAIVAPVFGLQMGGFMPADEVDEDGNPLGSGSLTDEHAYAGVS